MSSGKKIFFFLCASMLLAIPATAQTDSIFKYSKTIAGDFAYFNVDNLDNIYLVNNNNQLKKLNSNGDSVGIFNDVKKYGKLFYIDVANPLKLLLYYQNFSTVVVLDRFLMVRNVINLRRQNIFNVKAIASSYDNNIWVFDEGDAKLKKIGESGDVLSETVDCRLLFDTVPSPITIIDQDGFVNLYDPAKGFYIFDIYGALKIKLSFTHWKNVEVFNKTLYGFADGALQQYPVNSFESKQYVLPSDFNDAIQSKAINNKIYLLKENGLQQFTIGPVSHK